MTKMTTASARAARPGRHADGSGLYLLVKPSGTRSWLLRIQVDGRRRDIGLGAAVLAARDFQGVDDIPLLHRRDLSLADARRKAAILREAARAGRDPVIERDKDRRAVPTFAAAAIACHAQLATGWDPRHAAAFLSTLERHAYSALGHLPVDQIESSHIRDSLAAIWTSTPMQARKVRQRINTVLNFSKSKGWRATEAPGRSVTVGLARQAQGGNFASMPYAEVPDFIRRVAIGPDTVGRLALLFAIATAARSGEVRSARWSHIDEHNALWNRPAECMKAKTAHSVTLSLLANSVLGRAAELRARHDEGLIFPGRDGKPLSDMTLSKAMRQAGGQATVHGFRSSFRDWAAEQMSNIPDPVAEAALAHTVADKVVAAYKRTNFLEMRKELLNSWGRFLVQFAPKIV